jgi:hypothetical protein
MTNMMQGSTTNASARCTTRWSSGHELTQQNPQLPQLGLRAAAGLPDRLEVVELDELAVRLHQDGVVEAILAGEAAMLVPAIVQISRLAMMTLKIKLLREDRRL